MVLITDLYSTFSFVSSSLGSIVNTIYYPLSTSCPLQVFAEITEVLTQITRMEGRQKVLSDLHHMSAQTIFSVLDYLTKWKYRSVLFKIAEAKGTLTSI